MTDPPPKPLDYATPGLKVQHPPLRWELPALIFVYSVLAVLAVVGAFMEV